ncbi:hypothetical protein QFC22_001216 [Naganishia vaughanmartiniae]|uniref:Uncharacterized protein n=1 Tax=Naganishia vaughanmartiniae TaxID=1424756 RepID=A0ACC2XIC3_9TREE|nr:hypothetical protein QFC22_001216 [Naganishia vaughanmartiniae]
MAYRCVAIQKHEDEFAVFGKEDGQGLVVGYTQSEYEKWLHDDKWTPDETSYLFSLLAEYDLRFLVVADRYAYLPKLTRTGVPDTTASSSSRKKTTTAAMVAASAMRRSARGTIFGGAGEEDYDSRDGTPAEGEGVFPLGDVKHRRWNLQEIKDRYYTICRRLIRNRPAKDEQARERALKAYEYDMRKEVQRKRNADALFHLTRPQIIEEEALYMELKKMEQTERRYRGEREDLMRRVNGLESGVLWPSASVPGGTGMEGNRVFGNGMAVGIGAQRARDGTVVGVDKLKKRKRGDEPDVAQAQDVEVLEQQPAAPEDDPEFDRRNNIYRLPSSGAASSSTRTLYQPAFLRSTKLAQPRSTSSALSTSRINELLEQHGVSPSRLLMPTRHNLEAYEALLGTCAMLVDVKRMVDRAEQEVRVLRMQKDTGYGGLGMSIGTGVGMVAPAGSMPPPPVPVPSEAAGMGETTAANNKVRSARSASVVSSASEAVSRRRK